MAEILPYVGYEGYLFSKPFEQIINELRGSSTGYVVEHWPNSGCTSKVAWDVIRIGNTISLFFAKGCLFKIYFENAFEGSLYNGVHLEQKIEEAIAVDETLKYDDWEEVYISDHGYWLEDDIETGRIISITVFIKELEDDNYFYSYKWCTDSSIDRN